MCTLLLFGLFVVTFCLLYAERVVQDVQVSLARGSRDTLDTDRGAVFFLHAELNHDLTNCQNVTSHTDSDSA